MTPPAAGMAGEPFDIAEFRRHMRLADSRDDARLTDCIKAARHHAEQITGRAIARQKYLWTMPTFPGQTIVDVLGPFPGFVNNPVPSYSWSNYQIKVPRPTLVSIDKLQYVDPVSGALVDLLATTGYVLDTSSLQAILTPPADGIWPPTQASTQGVQIQFTAGYSAAQLVGEPNLVLAIKLKAESIFDGHTDPAFDSVIETYLAPYLVGGFAE